MKLSPAERSRKWREENVRECCVCHRVMTIKARGMCATCYNREWRKTPKAKEIIRRSNAKRSTERNGAWGSVLYHHLQSLPCTICGWRDATRDVHHIVSRSEGGNDTASNLITLCPNHHRMADLGLISASELLQIVEHRVLPARLDDNLQSSLALGID